MVNPPKTCKFVPMRSSFLLLYASVLVILLAFIGNGIWFSREVQGLGESINLAGSQRMRIIKIALLAASSTEETGREREATLTQARAEMTSFEETLAILEGGSRQYRIKKNQDRNIGASLERLRLSWSEIFKPQFVEILRAAPVDQKRSLGQQKTQLHDFVERAVNELARQLIAKMNRAERIFLGLRYALTGLCLILMGINLIYLRRRIIQPIGALIRDTEKMAAGNYTLQVEVPAQNEFMLLAQRFNAMGAAIATSFATMEETIRQRTAELSSSELHMRLLMDSTGEGIYGIDLHGCCTFINRAGSTMLGYTPEELRGKNMHEVIHHSKPDGSHYPVEECPIYQAFRTGVAAHIDNEWLWRKDRSFMPVEYASSPILVAGEIAGAVITFNDISELTKARAETRKLFEETLAQNRALEQANRLQLAMMRDLSLAMDAANVAARAKSDFLANMSHEIRTPMNAIMGMAHLLAKTPLDEQQADYLRKIDSSTQGLLGVINDILDFSKIEAGKLDLEARPFNLDTVLNRLADTTMAKAQEKGVALRFSRGEEVPLELLGDPLRLGQILLNLTGNAIKFTKEGEVLVKVELLEKTGEQLLLRFSVKDSGIGMSASQQEKLFQPFSQADSSTTRAFGGTGLGLSISKQLVEMMGGEIKVSSAAGQGSTFSFTARFAVPDESQSRVPQSPELLDPVAHLRGARILLAEDNEINQQVAREILEGAGLLVTIANNGQEAVELARTGNFQLILMDIQMPLLDGIGATAAIRAQPGGAAIPVVAMTAHAMSGDREKSLAAGMDDHITKPVNPAILLATLAKHLPPGTRPVPEPRGNSVLSSPPPVPGYFPDLPGIELANGLARVGGNRTLFRSLLEKFSRDFAGAGSTLSELLARPEDLPQALRLIHTIKGVAGNIGAEQLATTSAALELALKNGEAKIAAKELQEANRELEKILLGLQALTADRAAQPSPAPGPGGSEELLRELLGRLQPHLRLGAPTPCKAIVKELASYSWPEPTATALLQLDALVQGYKFKEAEELAARLGRR